MSTEQVDAVADPLVRDGRDFRTLSGPLTEPPDGPYRVTYRCLDSAGLRTLLIVVLNVAVEVGFVLWLLAPTHHPDFTDETMPDLVRWANYFVIGSVAVVEALRMVNVVSLSLATFLARDPVPVRPPDGLRVAFLTTIVPGKEPLEMVRATLDAARRIRYSGRIDVWLLDEGDTEDVRDMCALAGARHFSRHGVEQYNQSRGEFKARTKHGNYNSWLDAHGHRYDVFLSVDPDHVPVPEYAERMLGYFRDPDVAFVVAPQCYANGDTIITRAAESQQFPFHSVIQRAANAYGAPMLVGTNNAVRISALHSIGGLVDSVTEDMATGVALHTRRNPETGGRWRSVYTPDVVAVGEGPSSWGDFFGQQMRWSRGTFELLRGPLWRRMHRFGGVRWAHYLLITAFYPSMALGWLLGSVNAVLYLAVGAEGIIVPPQLWLALYVDATLFQLWVYVRNRRHNVSPFEAADSPGLRGMALTVLTSPIYASSLLLTMLRRPARFVVTPKSGASNRDTVWVFWRHLLWVAVFGSAIVAAAVGHRANVDVLMWPVLAVLICLTPMALAWLDAPDGPHEVHPPPEAEVPAPRAVTPVGSEPSNPELEAVA